MVLIVGAIIAGIILAFPQRLAIFSAFFNNSPIVDSHSPSDDIAEVNEGNMLAFTISAMDPDGDNITCSWKLSNEVVSEEHLTVNHTNSSWIYYPELGDRGEHTVECILSDGKGGFTNVGWIVTVHFVGLKVVIDSYEGQWIRDLSTDLPAYASLVSYSVSNLGDITALNVELKAYSNSETLMEKVVSINSNGHSYADQFYVTAIYNSDTSVGLQASCGVSFDSDSLEISPKLDRWPVSSNIRKLYITPNDPVIRSTVDEIFEGKSWWDIRADWKVLLEWVENEVHYEYDNVSFGVREYWQLPRETIANRKGDCEDQAILLCTLLRCRGYESDGVYVIAGYGEESGHSWITFRVFDILGYEFWRYLEPTSSGWFSDIGTYLYQIVGFYESEFGGGRVIFNDLVYEKP